MRLGDADGDCAVTSSLRALSTRRPDLAAPAGLADAKRREDVDRQEPVETRAATVCRSTAEEPAGTIGAKRSSSTVPASTATAVEAGMGCSLAKALDDCIARKIAKREATCRRFARRAKRRAALGVVLGPTKIVSGFPAPQFDPVHVRSRRAVFKHALEKKLSNGTYEPLPALMREIEKPDGGVRHVIELAVPDLAVSLHLFRRMMHEHGSKLGDHAFAYRLDRADLNAAAAVDHIRRALHEHPRLFVVEFDFKDFFDSIDHAYLFRVLRRMGVAHDDIALIRKLVLQGRVSTTQDYVHGGTCPVCGVGQGSPISLFLANVACWELDVAILRVATAYARFGDDSVVLVRTREEADEVKALFLRHCAKSGLKINTKKSPGIRVFSATTWAGAQPTAYIDFLGRRIFRDGVGLSDRSVERMKARVSLAIHRHLVLAAETPLGLSNPEDATRGLRGALKRLLLGGVPMHEVRRVLGGGPIVKQPRAYLRQLAFPDAAGNEALRDLDRWLLQEVQAAWRKRVRIADGRGVIVPPLMKRDIYSDASLPSFQLGSRYVRVWSRRKPEAHLERYEEFDDPDDDDDDDDETDSASEDWRDS